MSCLKPNFVLLDHPTLLFLELLLTLRSSHIDLFIENGICFLLFSKLSVNLLLHFGFNHAAEAITHSVACRLEESDSSSLTGIIFFELTLDL